MRNIRIGVVEDDPASCQLVLDYLNRYQKETGERFTIATSYPLRNRLIRVSPCRKCFIRRKSSIMRHFHLDIGSIIVQNQ